MKPEGELANIVHIGDDPILDIWGAKQADMQAILYEYEVPQELMKQPGFLYALSRAIWSVKDSEIKPDGRIKSLKEALKVIDSLQ